MTSVKPEEILVVIRIPATYAGAKFYFEKVADRNGVYAGIRFTQTLTTCSRCIAKGHYY